jgi:hypothetical protein
LAFEIHLDIASSKLNQTLLHTKTPVGGTPIILGLVKFYCFHFLLSMSEPMHDACEQNMLPIQNFNQNVQSIDKKLHNHKKAMKLMDQEIK